MFFNQMMNLNLYLSSTITCYLYENPPFQLIHLIQSIEDNSSGAGAPSSSRFIRIGNLTESFLISTWELMSVKVSHLVEQFG